MASLENLSDELEEREEMIDRGTIMAEILAENGGQGISLDALRAEAGDRLHTRMTQQLGAGARARVLGRPESDSTPD